MFTVHFFENKTIVLSQLLNNVPSVDENIKIKGRKGKVISVREVEGNIVQVMVEFEKKVKKAAIIKEVKKKKR